MRLVRICCACMHMQYFASHLYVKPMGDSKHHKLVLATWRSQGLQGCKAAPSTCR